MSIPSNPELLCGISRGGGIDGVLDKELSVKYKADGAQSGPIGGLPIYTVSTETNHPRSGCG